MMGPFCVTSNQQAMRKSILYRNNYIGKTQEKKEGNKSKREGNITGSGESSVAKTILHLD